VAKLCCLLFFLFFFSLLPRADQRPLSACGSARLTLGQLRSEVRLAKADRDFLCCASSLGSIQADPPIRQQDRNGSWSVRLRVAQSRQTIAAARSCLAQPQPRQSAPPLFTRPRHPRDYLTFIRRAGTAPKKQPKLFLHAPGNRQKMPCVILHGKMPAGAVGLRAPQSASHQSSDPLAAPFRAPSHSLPGPCLSISQTRAPDCIQAPSGHARSY
jgi:hypothetical protein